jgi:PKHD-type hydroxylase
MDGRVKFGVDKDDPRNLREFHKSNDITLGERPADAQDLTNQKPQVKLPIYNAILLPNNDEYIPGYICHTKERNPELVYTEEECDKILELTKTSYCTPASVGGSTHNSAINKKIRSANIYDVLLNEENKWIYDKLMMNVAFANKYHFDYEIAGVLHSLQLIEYDTSDEDNVGHYDWHTDFGMGDPATRKISVVVQLSDPNDYEECELMVNDHGNVLTATKERGSVHLFPSYQSHTVTNIKSGKRYSLVIWIHGSRRFR